MHLNLSVSLSVLLSKELLEQYKEGRRSFSDVIIQFADLRGVAIPDISIRNSKLLFVTFSNSNLRDAKFSNCDIFLGSFYGCDLTNAVFDNCTIELTLFENAVFDKTKIIKSKMSYCGMFNSNIRELDMSTSAQFKVFADSSQITETDVEDGMALLMPFFSNLGIEVKSKIKSLLETDAERWKVSAPDFSAMPHNKGAYAAGKTSSYRPAMSAYGGLIENLLQETINAYGTDESKKSYSTRRKYS